MPFPIVAADSRQAGSGLTTILNSTVYEASTPITNDGIRLDREWRGLHLLNLGHGIWPFSDATSAVCWDIFDERSSE